MNRALRTLALPAAALVAGLTLAACGGTSVSPSSSPTSSALSGMPGMTSSTTPGSAGPATGATQPGPHNAADVAFATDMVPHHAQAVTMADMALAQATTPDVKSLAAAIKAAQGPEIRTMSGWLAGWGAPVPDSGGHDMAGMGGASTGGMMSDQQMADLGQATGNAFDRMWLQLMTAHHRGAVATAKTELATGQSTEAKTLAQSIITGQSAEIATMSTLLGALPAV